ncbi:serine/threonine-protein kinase pim-2-like [Takifugu flavidus]|uniref:serine/threonine-protein kinase pim-2-like n=1 Tax=Takifugu flavidus TaxID=433684 RepID=UPI0025441973|nr:serine/threonine-protein kinase pim-2-like [Takifugu flavidus]
MQKLPQDTAGSAAHVQLLDWYHLFFQVLLVLERPVHCTDLFRYCRSKSKHVLEEDKAEAIMKQLIEEVKVFDNEGIFHQDLKLENILINTNSEEPQIWVIDFGVGCFYTKRSVYRVFQGAPQHVPPEYNLRGRYTAGPMTVWQLGVVLYDMLHKEKFETVPFLLKEQRIKEDLPKVGLTISTAV